VILALNTTIATLVWIILIAFGAEVTALAKPRVTLQNAACLHTVASMFAPASHLAKVAIWLMVVAGAQVLLEASVWMLIRANAVDCGLIHVNLLQLLHPKNVDLMEDLLLVECS
jgi:hypothetical protein